MIDIRFLRENPEAVKENIRKKFQEQKLPLVDEVIALDEESRKTQAEADQLRSDRNKISKSIGALMGQGKKDEAEKAKEEVAKINERLAALEPREAEITARIREIMLTIPQIMDPSVPIGKDDSCNVEIQRYGEPVVPDFEIPYHTDIMERLHGIDLEAAGKVAGNGLRQRFQIGSGLQALQALVDFSQLLRQGFRLNAVFPRHSHQLAHALFLRRQLIGINVAAACDVAHIGTDFAQFGFNARQHIQAFSKARLDVLQIGQ